MAKIVNQETLVPIGLAVAVIGGASVWVSDARNEIKANSEQIRILTENNGANIKLISEINSRLSRIEWKLEKPNK